jgi:hypothetical protein
VKAADERVILNRRNSSISFVRSLLNLLPGDSRAMDSMSAEGEEDTYVNIVVCVRIVRGKDYAS